MMLPAVAEHRARREPARCGPLDHAGVHRPNLQTVLHQGTAASRCARNVNPPAAKMPITSITLSEIHKQKQMFNDAGKRYRGKITPDNAR
jgi:hypothetical protein